VGLVPTMTVLENLFVGRYLTKAGRRLSTRTMERRAHHVLDGFGLGAIDVRRPVAGLGQTERVLVATARAFDDEDGERPPRVVVLDEPTAALPARDIDRLFEAIRVGAASGGSVLIVSHDMEEVRRITDRVTVLRDGEVSGTGDTSDFSPDEL